VAGSFYPAGSQQLRRTVASLVDADRPREPAAGVLVPHAGYIYSGACAGKTFSAVELPERLIILCPNHTGLGPPMATDEAEAWDTPLGPARVDLGLVRRLIEACPPLTADANAHRREHALEVQLPFLQHLRGESFSFAPICVGTARYEELEELGEALARVLASLGEPCLLVISSDMTHYEPADAARRKDERALGRLERLDAQGLHRVVTSEGITMCGFAPAVAALIALERRGASGGRLVEYTHSGVVTGDDREVVAYAGMVFA
jgi:AmmeMemoRadiSam system protein B